MKQLIFKIIIFNILFSFLNAENYSINQEEIIQEYRPLSVEEKYGDRIELIGLKFKDPLVLCQILIALFLIIALIQSAVDKIIDRDENIMFFNNHFSKSIIKNYSSFALTFLTCLELLCGCVLIFGIYYSFQERTTLWIFYGLVLSAINFIILFLGQRIAKDYVGAADLVPYFILIILGIMSMY